MEEDWWKCALPVGLFLIGLGVCFCACCRKGGKEKVGMKNKDNPSWGSWMIKNENDML